MSASQTYSKSLSSADRGKWNDQRVRQQKLKKQEWDGVEEGEVWVKFVYTAPERRGGGGEWED